MTSTIKNQNIYTKVIDNYNLTIEFKKLSNNIFDYLEKNLKDLLEGNCNVEGYIKKNSVKLLSHSVGELFGNNIKFSLIYEALISNPPESNIIECKVLSITKVGIRGQLNSDETPFIIFVARDHHYNNDTFSKININDIINVKVLGKRFELYDKYISIIAELI